MEYEKLDKNKIDEVRVQLRDFFDRNPDVSQNKLARQIYISGAVISQFLKGKYTGDNSSVANKLSKYFKRERDRQLSPIEEIQFVKTQNSKVVWGMCEYARNYKQMCVITGPPGSGKTIALKKYNGAQHATTLIEARLSIQAKTLFELLHEAQRLSGVGRVDNMMMELVERLKDTPHLLIIDEAEYLPYAALELVRRFWDFAQIGIILAGTGRLKDNLKGRKGEHAQLWSRVGNAEELGALKSSEAQQIIELNLPGVNGLWQVIYSYTKKNARVLGHLITLIKYLASFKETTIDEDLIIKAANQLIINK